MEGRGISSLSLSDFGVTAFEESATIGLPTLDPLMGPLRRACELGGTPISLEDVSAIGSNGHVVLDAMAPNLEAIQGALADALRARSLQPNLGKHVQYAVSELVRNAVDSIKKESSDPRIVILWDVEADQPFVIVQNYNAPLFNPAHYINRTPEQLIIDIENTPDNNHTALEVLASRSQHVSFRWESDSGEEVLAMLTCLGKKDPEQLDPDYQLLSTTLEGETANTEFNLLSELSQREGIRYLKLAVGVQFKNPIPEYDE